MALLTMILLAGLPPAASAGQAKPAQARAAESAPAQVQAPPVVDERTARDTRERLREIFEQYPPSVAQVLRLDPSLLTRPDYLALYPTLATYLAQHPEVAHNPVFFLGGPFNGQEYQGNRSQAVNAIENIFIGLEVLIGIVCAIFTLGWITRSAIEHRRWLRATKIQTDAHHNIVIACRRTRTCSPHAVADGPAVSPRRSCPPRWRRRRRSSRSLQPILCRCKPASSSRCRPDCRWRSVRRRGRPAAAGHQHPGDRAGTASSFGFAPLRRGNWAGAPRPSGT